MCLQPTYKILLGWIFLETLNGVELYTTVFQVTDRTQIFFHFVQLLITNRYLGEILIVD